MKIFKHLLYNFYRNLVKNPKHRWWVVIGTLLYLIDPIDLAPDTLPLIGLLDDGLIASVIVTELSQLLVSHIKTKKNNSDLNYNNNTTDKAALNVE